MRITKDILEAWAELGNAQRRKSDFIRSIVGKRNSREIRESMSAFNAEVDKAEKKFIDAIDATDLEAIFEDYAQAKYDRYS